MRSEHQMLVGWHFDIRGHGNSALRQRIPTKYGHENKNAHRKPACALSAVGNENRLPTGCQACAFMNALHVSVAHGKLPARM